MMSDSFSWHNGAKEPGVDDWDLYNLKVTRMTITKKLLPTAEVIPPEIVKKVSKEILTTIEQNFSELFKTVITTNDFTTHASGNVLRDLINISYRFTLGSAMVDADCYMDS